MKKLVILVAVLSFCNFASGLTVLEPGYTVETYATYSGSNVSEPYCMTFGDNQNLYITQRFNDGRIWRVEPNGIATVFASGLDRPTGIDWGGGTSYGDYLYVVLSDLDAIKKVSTSGTVYNFASGISDAPSPLEIDKTGNYGGKLYTATTGYDKIYKVTTGGSVSTFSSFPGDYSNGGPYAIAFDPGTEYGGLMYVGTAFSGGNPPPEGIFSMDTSGNATLFCDLEANHTLNFDPVGDFGGEMFVSNSNLIRRVAPDGTPTDFIQKTSDRIKAFTFGADGAMYVAEYTASTHTVVINKVKAPIYEKIIYSILDAIDYKTESLQKIEAALEKEESALSLLDEILDSGELGDLNRSDVIEAKIRIRKAISRQRLSKRFLQQGIGRLEEALTKLGCQIEPINQ